MAIVNRAALNMGVCTRISGMLVMGSFEHVQLHHMAAQFLVFWKPSILTSIMVAWVYSFFKSRQASPFPQVLTNTVVICFLNGSYSGRGGEMECQNSSHLQFPWWLRLQNILKICHNHSYFFFLELSVQFHGPLLGFRLLVLCWRGF